MVYTVAVVAKRAGKAPNTIRTWTAEFAGFLSAGAQPTGGERLYNEDDLSVLLTVAGMRAERKTFGAISAGLADGERVQLEEEPDSPPNATESPGSALVTLETVIRLTATVAAAEATENELRDQRDQLQSRLDSQSEQLLEATSLAAAATAALDELRRQSRPFWRRWFSRDD